MRFALRLGAALLTGGFLAACAAGGNTIGDQGDQTGFVAADGSAVLLSPGERGEPVDFTAPLVGGGDFTLADTKGVVVLNVWGPWCAPCRKELPELERLYREFAAAGMSMVGIATRSNDAAVQAFIRKHDITYPQLADYESRSLATIPGVPFATVPTTLFVDDQRRLAGWALGAVEPTLIKSFIESLLDES